MLENSVMEKSRFHLTDNLLLQHYVKSDLISVITAYPLISAPNPLMRQIVNGPVTDVESNSKPFSSA